MVNSPDGVKTRDADFLSDSVTESLAEMSELEETLANENANKTTPGNTRLYWSILSMLKSYWLATSSQRLGRKYGLQPKFVKMRELHLLMFYLIYGYSGEADLDQTETIEQLRREGLVDNKVIHDSLSLPILS